MDKVNFTKMENGTAEEYAFLEQLEEQFKADLPTVSYTHLTLPTT